MNKKARIWSLNKKAKIRSLNKKAKIRSLNKKAKIWSLNKKAKIWSLNKNSKIESLGILDPAYPSVHNSRLFLDTSRISRKDDKPTNNGSIYFSSPVNLPPNLNATSNTSPLNDITNPTSNNNVTGSSLNATHSSTALYRHGVLRSLSLLSVLSLLLALNSLIFLLKNVWPSGGIHVN
ncbi:unnamed protein product, partial [Allacma fusca]